MVSNVMEIVIGVLVIAFAIDAVYLYRQHGLQYPFLTHACYLMVAIVGIIFIILVPFITSLPPDLINQVTIAGLGFAFATVGYTIMVQTNSDYEQRTFQTRILNDLERIRTALNIPDE